jgi:hypothetical protein
MLRHINDVLNENVSGSILLLKGVALNVVCVELPLDNRYYHSSWDGIYEWNSARAVTCKD